MLLYQKNWFFEGLFSLVIYMIKLIIIWWKMCKRVFIKVEKFSKFMRKVLSGDGGFLLGEYNIIELCLSYYFFIFYFKLSVLL